ncbi:Predicted branched-chain amino acid permease (azaleucine resistance) [Lachnospiraceae bacterium]|nr:Predicted branched-chain amino acid permease (azaleucine resistance) [Lachnospiraceae bacterium]
MTVKSNAFRDGLKDGIPICLGYLAVSFAFGIQAVSSGLTVFQATLISLSNLTSAGQFAGLGVIAASGSLLEMAGVQFIINLRYMLMSAAISQKLSPDVSTLKRMGIAFGMTDEVFGISAARPGHLEPAYSAGAIIIATFGWTLGTFLGAYSGEILPAGLISALGVALYGMFIAIVIPVARDDKNIMLTALAAMLMSAAFTFLPYLNRISSGFRIIIVTVVTAGVAAALFPVSETEEGAVCE